MAGHSKWKNIKRKKEKTDAQKAKIFTKIGREMAVCVREGGADPTINGRLRDLIAKAKGLNVPNDNINRVIKKAEGNEKDDYEIIVYEGYGPAGIAVMVNTLTDNRNRTAASMRHYFDKYGASLGQVGSVAFMFEEKGVVLLEGGPELEEKLMEDAFEAGADDFEMQDGGFEVNTAPAKVYEVSHALEEKGYVVATAQAEYVPANYVGLTDADDIKKMSQLLNHLEDDDDVQDVWHNIENEDDLDR